MPFVKIWIHFVWSTRNREPLLIKEIWQQVFNHIKGNAKKKDIYMNFINGHIAHVHCLISLDVNHNIGKIMQLIKGESSFLLKITFARRNLNGRTNICGIRK